MFIVSIEGTYGITNVNQVSNIYVDEPHIMVLTPKVSFPIYECSDIEQLDYVYRKIVEHIITDKTCYITDIEDEFFTRSNPVNGG